jgi:hypothetical protein
VSLLSYHIVALEESESWHPNAFQMLAMSGLGLT